MFRKFNFSITLKSFLRVELCLQYMNTLRANARRLWDDNLNQGAPPQPLQDSIDHLAENMTHA